MTIRKLIPFFLALALPAFAAPERIAIIKADDVTSVNGKWDRFFKVSQDLGIPVSAGVIAASFEKQDEKYDQWLKKWEATGKVEFWNHGWDHRQWQDGDKKKSEFGGSGYDHQKANLAKAQEAAKTGLGKPFAAFGSGFNAMDSDTAKALNEIPELTLIFCYPGAKPAKELKGKVLLPMHLRGEGDGPGKPNFAKFKEELRQVQGRVCQKERRSGPWRRRHPVPPRRVQRAGIHRLRGNRKVSQGRRLDLHASLRVSEIRSEKSGVTGAYQKLSANSVRC
jgi:hypothetical protein